MDDAILKLKHIERFGFQVEIKLLPDDNNDVELIIKNKRKNYVGKEITIYDNKRIYSHVSECVNNLPSVFRLNSRPWINPDSSRAEEIIDTTTTTTTTTTTFIFFCSVGFR